MDFKTDYRLMQVKSIAECSTFTKLPFVIKISVLSIFEWPLRTRFTVGICFFNNRYAITVWYMDKTERERARLDFFQEGKYGIILFFVCLYV